MTDQKKPEDLNEKSADPGSGEQPQPVESEDGERSEEEAGEVDADSIETEGEDDDAGDEESTEDADEQGAVEAEEKKEESDDIEVSPQDSEAEPGLQTGVDAEQSECIEAEGEEPEPVAADAPERMTAGPVEDGEEAVIIDDEESASPETDAKPRKKKPRETPSEMIDKLTKALEIRDFRLDEWEDTHQELQDAHNELAEEHNKLTEAHEELKEEAEQLNTRMMRAVADLENYRRRSEREKEDLKRYGIDDVVSELIPVVDNLERALGHADDQGDESSLADGVRMVYRQLITALKKHGVEGFESVGEMFNPERHEAIQQVETPDHETGTVIEQFQKGYFLHDRLLRPALVSVAKHVEPEQDEEPLAETEPDAEATDSDTEGGVDPEANGDEAIDAEESAVDEEPVDGEAASESSAAEESADEAKDSGDSESTEADGEGDEDSPSEKPPPESTSE